MIKFYCEKDATPPMRATQGSAGYDLCTLRDTFIKSDGVNMVHTGVHVEVPEGHVGLLCIRSGIASKHGLSLVNGTGVIDSDYRGEIIAAVIAKTTPTFLFSAGTRFCQLVIVPCVQQDVQVVSSLEDLLKTDRDTGGFGSTGK